MRDGNLFAYALSSGQERQIAAQVHEFTATPDGRLLALVRGNGLAREIWLLDRSSGAQRQLTTNDFVEGELSFAPDGMTLAYTAVNEDLPRPLEIESWARWCDAGTVRLLDIASGREQTLEPGCDPAFAPDGRRLAFSTPPRAMNLSIDVPTATNALRIVNRAGANGWTYASASLQNEGEGQLVYAPSWSPDASEIAYQRFLGYQSLVDVLLTETGNAFRGGGTVLGAGAGWLLAPSFAPGGGNVAVVEHNWSDARGLSGYEIWSTTLLDLATPSEIILPVGPLPTDATELVTIRRAAGASWSPDGAALALLLPAGWTPEADEREPLFENSDAGAIWQFDATGTPLKTLIVAVDFASPLIWLDAAPASTALQGISLKYPASWQLDAPSEFAEITARVTSGGLPLLTMAAIPVEATTTVSGAFSYFVAEGAQEEAAITMPDGSIYRAFSGVDTQGRAVAGAMRVVSRDGGSYAILYLTDATRWPLERAQAQALLAGSGRENSGCSIQEHSVNIETSLLGVPITIRPTAFGAGVLSSLVVALLTREHRVLLSTAAGMLWYSADAAHVVGHIVSSQLVDAPMDGVDFGIYPMSVYLDHEVSPMQHIGRAAGGLTASLSATLVLAMLARMVPSAPAKQILTIAAAQNGLISLVSLLPIPMVDGGVIYANMRKLQHGHVRVSPRRIRRARSRAYRSSCPSLILALDKRQEEGILAAAGATNEGEGVVANTCEGLIIRDDGICPALGDSALGNFCCRCIAKCSGAANSCAGRVENLDARSIATSSACHHQLKTLGRIDHDGESIERRDRFDFPARELSESERASIVGIV
ncbi:hypothetical protein HC891_24090 [Candidatus Gracilibacteria bacterium]|nr:hypothetical protein [Candidatus Gracilibacteria bacterium]